MASLEHKAVNAILSRIRARHETAPARGGRPVQAYCVTKPATLRAASLADFEGITELKRRGGIVIDPIENWERLWVRNPALDKMRGLEIGWVLEVQHEIVGYLGNIALLYRYADKTLTAVTGTGFVVDPEYRAMSLSLDSAFYRQKAIDLHLATTAIEAVGKLAVAFRSAPLPQPDFEAVLFWVLQAYPFAQAVVKKLDLAPPFPGLGSLLGTLAVKSDKFLRRRRPSQCATDLEVTEIGVTDIGEEFQAFWEEKVKERLRLYADRSAATLRWHFSIPGHRGDIRVLCCRRKGTLVGYAVVRNDTERPDGLKASVIADFMARQDDEEIVRALFVAVFEIARSAKSHMLEVIGLPEEIRKVLSESKPYIRRLPACPFYYRANNPVLHDALSDAATWYACAYDGDRTLMP
jgi:hypothetical protein